MPSPRRRRSQPESLFGSGDLLVSGLSPEAGGSGISLQDARPIGFLARITAQPDPATNAYGFARVDEGDPTFPALTGDAAINGDGVSLAAFAQDGSLTVPTDSTAVVWLEPLRNGVGYSFRYVAAAGAMVYGSQRLVGSFGITSRAAWLDTGLTLTLPAAGTYRVSGRVTGVLVPTAGGSLFTAGIYARLYDASAAAAVADSASTVAWCAANPGTTSEATAPIAGDVTVTGAGTVKLQVYLDDPSLIVAIDGIAARVSSSDVSGCTVLSYLKVG